MLTFLPKIVPFMKILPLILLVVGSAYGGHMYIVSQLKQTVAEQQQQITVIAQRAELLQSAADINEETIQRLRDQIRERSEQIEQLSRNTQTLLTERDQYLSIFRRHDLTRLSRARPGLIQPRINSGTADVFRQLEQDSRELHHAQDTNSNNPPDTP